MNGNDIVAEFIRTLDWDALPLEVRQKAKLCLLDGLGATVRRPGQRRGRSGPE